MADDISRLLTSHLNVMISEAKDELQMLKDDLWVLKTWAEQGAGMRELELDRKIKEVVYDVEDTFESWLTEKVAVAAKNILSRRILMSMQGYALAREIKSIRDGRLEPLNRRIRTYRDLQIVQTHPTQANEVGSEQPYIEVPSIELCNIFEDEAETLIRNLMEETEELDVISITGMPGIGKTTLARKIYQDHTIMREFPTRIWVDIPLDFHRKTLYLNIIQGFISLHNPQGSCSKGSYIEILYEFQESGRISDGKFRACLEKSRFLLVMDGVWTADTLESIMHLLPKNGKVLITSRHNHITRKPHLLRFLNKKESWELLQLAVFGKLDDCTEMLKSTGKCIAESCDGSPLAIAVLANSLMVPSEAAKDLTEKWWKKVSENVTMYVTDYCAHDKVFKSIEMSYTKLPQCLRNCFLYLGVFPEGHEIPVWTLTRLWIAEGLVQDIEGLSLEGIADYNLYDLVNRNLVVVGKIYPNGQIKTCRLHKVIYGFCKYKAAEQDFYHEIKISKGGALDRPRPLTPNHRRLCIDSCLSDFLSSGPEGRCVRSILCLNKSEEVLPPDSGSNIHKSFKLLKVFECKRIKFAKFPTKLSKLMNLRYISLSCDDLDVIPEAISRLCYLETLVVDTQSASLKLKANIWRMPQLQHLVTKAAIVLAIRGRGEAGKKLQTLTRLAPECCTEDVFRRAPSLNRVGIRGQLAALLAADSLSKMESLQRLKLVNESAAADSRLHHLLHRNFFPPNIRRLTLSATYLRWESMSVLGKIDSLEILKLKNNAIMGESWKTDADGFRSLVFLWIGTTDLVSWEASSADCFPLLKCIVLNNCEQLHQIPSTLAKTLDTLDVDEDSVSGSAVESAREIKLEIARRQGQTKYVHQDFHRIEK